MLSCKPIDTPMEKNHRLPLVRGVPMDDRGSYCRLVDCLVYLFVTRPELMCYDVHTLAQFLNDPHPHRDVAIRVLCYVKGNHG